VNGGAIAMSTSRALRTSARNFSANATASAAVMCIFQFATKIGLRTQRSNAATPGSSKP
jgi:hypothetical protein